MSKLGADSNNGSTNQSHGPFIWQTGARRWQLDQTALVMAILNVTPDSFSDGGRHFRLKDSLASASRFVADGADILDIGGESTRPGAREVGSEEERARVIPVIEALADPSATPISIDTCKPTVARAALQAGAGIVNDVSGLRDPAMVEICAGSDCGVVVMHMQGTPRTMQRNPQYADPVDEVRAFFEERLETLTRAGISPERLVFDPGIGFGKTLAHNLALINGISQFLQSVDRPILIGLSRKSFLGTLVGSGGMDDREVPTQTLTCLSRQRGALIHRVHQVQACREALRMTEAVI